MLLFHARPLGIDSLLKICQLFVVGLPRRCVFLQKSILVQLQLIIGSREVLDGLGLCCLSNFGTCRFELLEDRLGDCGIAAKTGDVLLVGLLQELDVLRDCRSLLVHLDVDLGPIDSDANFLEG